MHSETANNDNHIFETNKAARHALAQRSSVPRHGGVQRLVTAEANVVAEYEQAAAKGTFSLHKVLLSYPSTDELVSR